MWCLCFNIYLIKCLLSIPLLSTTSHLRVRKCWTNHCSATNNRDSYWWDFSFKRSHYAWLFKIIFNPFITEMWLIIFLHKLPEPPVLQLRSDWLDVFPSEKVELFCIMTGSSDWTFIWYKDDKEFPADSNTVYSSEKPLLTITAQMHHTGNYSCKGQHKTRSTITKSSNLVKVSVHGESHYVLLPIYCCMFT